MLVTGVPAAVPTDEALESTSSMVMSVLAGR
jgi:hypothetical protein